MTKLKKIPATENQKAFMKALLIKFPKDVTKMQALDLIFKCLADTVKATKVNQPSQKK